MKFLVFPCIVLFASTLWAETVILKDGSKIEGRLQRLSDGWTVTEADGTVVRVNANDVKSIEVSHSPDTAAKAADRLASIRNATENMTDLGQIIARYETFVSQTTDAKILDDANKDLALWRDRQSQGLVKLGSKWVTSRERDYGRQQAQSEAISANSLIVANRLKEAASILKQALIDDPQCATALYLQGVLLYGQDQVAPARKSFEAVRDLMPNHAPTLNNLAVISWRQKSYVAAFGLYDEAMGATPNTREVLDNVAEALNAIPTEIKQAPVVARASKLFQQQDTQLQLIVGRDGLYRWGSGWVTEKQLADLKAAEDKVNQQIQALSQQFDAIQVKIGEIDSEVDQNIREMHRLQSGVLATDSNGNTIQVPLPPIYYQLDSDNTRLLKNKKTLQTQQENLRTQVKQLQKTLPTPKFTGLQKIIGVAGAPGQNMEIGQLTTRSLTSSSAIIEHDGADHGEPMAGGGMAPPASRPSAVNMLPPP